MFGILTLSSGLCFDIFGGKGIHVYFSECFHCARCIHFSGVEIGAQGEEVTCLRSQSGESIAGWGPNSSRLLLALSLPSLSSHLALLLLLLPPHHCPHQLRLSPISPHISCCSGDGAGVAEGSQAVGAGEGELPARHKEPEGHCGPRWGRAEVRFRAEPTGCSRAPGAPPTVPVPVCPPAAPAQTGEGWSQHVQRTTSEPKPQVCSLAVG